MNTVPTTVTVEPPPADMSASAEQMLALARSYRIDCVEMREAAGEDLQRVKAKAKELTEKRLAITRPLDAAKAAVMALFRAPLEYLDSAEATLKRAILAYDAEQDRKRREAEAEATRKADEERRRLAAAAAKEREAGNVETATAIAEAAQFVAPIPVAEHAPVKVAGESHREVWHAEVDDLVALARAVVDGKVAPACILPNMPVLNGQARALKGALSVPGVRAVCERILAARAAA